MPTLYFKNVSADGSWSNSSNWFEDDACTIPALNAPWMNEDVNYLHYDLTRGADSVVAEDEIYIDSDIQSEVTGSCDIGYIGLGGAFGSLRNNSSIYGGIFSGNSFYNSGSIYGGIFSGYDFINGGYIYSGIFLGSYFNNSSEIYGGIFFGLGFENYAYIYGGLWLERGTLEIEKLDYNLNPTKTQITGLFYNPAPNNGGGGLSTLRILGQDVLGGGLL